MNRKTEPEEVDFETLKKDINMLAADASKMTQKLSELGRERAENIRDSIAETSKHTMHGVEKKFKEKPIVTVGSAFGIGVLLGMIIKRCSRG